MNSIISNNFINTSFVKPKRHTDLIELNPRNESSSLKKNSVSQETVIIRENVSERENTPEIIRIPKRQVTTQVFSFNEKGITKSALQKSPINAYEDTQQLLQKEEIDQLIGIDYYA